MLSYTATFMKFQWHTPGVLKLGQTSKVGQAVVTKYACGIGCFGAITNVTVYYVVVFFRSLRVHKVVIYFNFKCFSYREIWISNHGIFSCIAVNFRILEWGFPGFPGELYCFITVKWWLYQLMPIICVIYVQTYNGVCATLAPSLNHCVVVCTTEYEANRSST